MPPPPAKREIAILGFPAVGKSSLAAQFVDKTFNESYVTTIANEKKVTHTVCGKTFDILLYDTMGIAELPSLEDRYYQMDGWVLVYSVTERRSFDVLSEIFDKLKVAINDKKHLPIVVVGNKMDLTGNRDVTIKEGQEFANSVSAHFVECSAKENANVTSIFESLIKEIERDRGEPLNTKGDGCTIL